MGTERVSKRVPPTPKLPQRRRLSDITNFPISASWADTGDESWTNCLQKTNQIQLQKDVDMLRKMLSEKDATIESQAEHIQKLTVQSRQKSAQNEEIIQHYCRLYKDLTQAREELKLRQHEYSQRSAAYKIDKSELQLKLDETKEQLNQLLQEKANKNYINANPPSIETKPVRPKIRRRHSISPGLEMNRALFSPAKRSTSRYRHSVGLRMLQKLEEEVVSTPNVQLPKTSFISLPSRVKKEKKQQPSKSIVPSNSSEKLSPPDIFLNKFSGRPARTVTASVASYKEPPLNTKMRRST